MCSLPDHALASLRRKKQAQPRDDDGGKNKPPASGAGSKREMNRSYKKKVFIKDSHTKEEFELKQYKVPELLGKKKGFAGGAVSSAKSGPFGDLAAWVESKGGKADGLAVGEVTPGRRGIFATRSFKKGETIFSIPHDSCILDEGLADASPVSAVWKMRQALETQVPVPSTHKVALYLIFNMVAGDGDWAEAGAMLPTRTDFETEGGPMLLWSSAEVAEVHCPALISKVENDHETLREVYDQVVGPVWTEESGRAGSSLHGVAPPSFADFELAVGVVTSRAYVGDESKGQGHLLIPLVDQCNHDNPSLVNTVKTMAPWGDFMVLAAFKIQKGDEILVTHGPLPNRQLLTQFGSVLPVDPKTLTDAAMPGSNSPLVDFMAALPADHDADAVEALCLKGALQRSRPGGPPVATQKIGPLLEEAAAALGLDYKKLLSDALETYPTLLEEDRALLEAPATPRQRLALDFRMAMKAKLQEEIGRV
eukprot:CAMPEP_0172620030 /NCGR_PEP_ID=MMETSP1068-20121228/99387_1 /TAXON_ID=35684 /ORGANISM="Pseudopedinella elastica, Strain CCMP716" /LENGTH=479 /DNA_ID=CAMNT_0013427103 /DNA_START=41 /DNA_END=1481 /DNA_ORIENTATION=+